MSTIDLFSPFRLGPLQLPNRIVMAPMTRNRAGPGNAPTALNATHYAQRASAGLIIAEASQVSPQGLGYPGTPGIHSAEQIAAWAGKPVDAFAWTFSWDSITPQAWELIQQHHRFCFAPCPGSVDCVADSQNLIWRTEIEVAYQPSDFRFMYAGLADPLWRSKRDRLRAMLRPPSEPR